MGFTNLAVSDKTDIWCQDKIRRSAALLVKVNYQSKHTEFNTVSSLQLHFIVQDELKATPAPLPPRIELLFLVFVTEMTSFFIKSTQR